jgi:hypothetical protein
VSVWVTFRDRQAIEVYTTSDLSPQASIEPPGAVEGIPEHLTFSENGDRLFITWADRDVISVYRHDQRRLSLAREITAAGTTGPVLRDRRASRIYRMNNAGELVEFFARNGERISVHERPAFLPAQAAAVGPEIRTVQGINAEAPATPASSEYPRALPAREDGDIAVLRGPSRIETYSLRELADAKDARGSRPAAVTSAGNGAVVVATDAGELLIIDGRSMEPVSVAEPSAETPTGGFAELIPWRVETSGNFACF